MFGSTSPFGQSSTSPFGSPSVFGQTSSAMNNPFAPKPFGSTNPFGSQTGSSIFGGTSTGVFGQAQSSSPFSSTTTFGASPFGASAPAFGASTTPAFGNSSSSFGGSSAFGQRPAFGNFGSATQSSPFGSTTQQSQPAFGNTAFGSSPFGAASTSAFGVTSTPAFGVTSTPAFGATSTPTFGASSTPSFGATSTPAFGSTTTSAFGSPSPAFGMSNSSIFGSGFGASSTPAFGNSSTPAFGAPSTPAFGASSTPAFSFGSSPTFGQSTSAFSSSPFGTATSPFGAQSSSFGSQATTPAFGSGGSTFGQSAFGTSRGGSRIAPYTPTTETDGQPAGKLESISAMPIYKDKSHEELRWEDYQLGDKGGAAPSGQAAAGAGFAASLAPSNPFASSSTFGQTSTNLFPGSTPSNLFAPKSSQGFGSSSTQAFGSSPFGTSSSPNPFGATSSIFGNTSTSAFVPGSSSSSPFGSSPFGSTSQTPPPFGSTSQGTTTGIGPSFNFTNPQTSSLFPSTTPSVGQTGSPFGQSGAFGQISTPSFGQSSTLSLGQSTIPSFGQQGLFNSTGGGMFPSTQSMNPSSSQLGFGQTTPSMSSPFQSTQTAPAGGAFGFNNFGQAHAANTIGFGAMPNNTFGQNIYGQLSTMQGSTALQSVPVTNPFGTLPAMPQMSIGQAGTAPSVRYGISSMPVAEKPAPVRISSLLTSRHLSQRRIRWPARKYQPKNDGPKVPFFNDDEDTFSRPKADAFFFPRENPRALVIRPTEQWSSRSNTEKTSGLKERSMLVHENGKRIAEGAEIHLNGDADNHVEDRNHEDQALAKVNQKSKVVHDDHAAQDDASMTINGQRAGEAAIVYEHGADIEALMPKIRNSDHYTEPRIQELAAKERAEPGFCRHVSDFVVGRIGYGSIKFLGETDVRRLDLESLIQFSNREVVVYMDESKKPPVGQGLNKAAEITLLNIKCFDKNSGQQYTEGPRIERYKELLKRKGDEQGAEFVSYDAKKGEWKFRVKHFSVYKLENEDDWVLLTADN